MLQIRTVDALCLLILPSHFRADRSDISRADLASEARANERKAMRWRLADIGRAHSILCLNMKLTMTTCKNRKFE